MAVSVRDPWFSALYDAVTAQLEHELDGLGYDGNVEGVEAIERIKAAVAEVNEYRHRESSTLAPLPVGSGHPSHEDISKGVIADLRPQDRLAVLHVLVMDATPATSGLNSEPHGVHRVLLLPGFPLASASTGSVANGSTRLIVIGPPDDLRPGWEDHVTPIGVAWCSFFLTGGPSVNSGRPLLCRERHRGSRVTSASSNEHELRAEIRALRSELRRQWESNHSELCDVEWPHLGECHWPPPDVLRLPVWLTGLFGSDGQKIRDLDDYRADVEGLAPESDFPGGGI